MITHSIRWRLQAWHGLLLVLVLCALGFTAFEVAWQNQLRRIDDDLDQQFGLLMSRQRDGDRRAFGRPAFARRNELAPGQSPGDGPPANEEPAFDGPPPGFDEFGPGEMQGPDAGGPDRRGPERAFFLERIRDAIQQASVSVPGQTNSLYFAVWQYDGSLVARSAGAPEGIPLPQRPWTTAAPSSQATNQVEPPPPDTFQESMTPEGRTRGVCRELYRFMPFGECVLVGRPMTAEITAMRRLAASLAAAGGGVLLLGLAGGWWLAARAIRPIEDISATALKIAAGDLSQRINAADAEDELGRLAGVLNSTFARLEAAFTHQARFTSDASHELRTPVTVILSQTQTALSRERPAAEYREALAACQRAAQRMRGLIESLLALARIDAGQAAMKRAAFDLSQVVRDSVEMVRPLAAERGIEIRCDLSRVECLGDAERVGQIAINLLTNAIHFNRDCGEVRVATRVADNAAVLTVADTGPGIPAEDQPHVFERFYRVDKSRSRVQGRTGLGLAICKAIVDAHSGSIEVASAPGAGSTFTVKLPLR